MLITQTPLRISIAGGGTDLASFYTKHTGSVLSTAIDKYIYVILNKRFDSKIYISYSQKEIVDSVDEIKHDLVREAMRKAGVENGVEIAIMADIPSSGSGLGSSSSLTVGLLNAFYAYQGIQVTAEQLAAEACDIEINTCGKPIGKQDQYIAAYGGLCLFEFCSDGSVHVEQLSITKEKRLFGDRLLLFFTNITRKADAILSKQNKSTDKKLSELIKIGELAYEAKEAVLSQNYNLIGDILRRNWDIKKSLVQGITRPEIDKMVNTVLNNGALGCKICGAGGGGFLMTYSTPDKIDSIRKSMENYREMPFLLERCGSRVMLNVDSYEWL